MSNVKLVSLKSHMSVHEVLFGALFLTIAVVAAVLLDVANQKSQVILFWLWVATGPLVTIGFVLRQKNQQTRMTPNGDASLNAAQKEVERELNRANVGGSIQSPGPSLSMKFAVLGSKAVIQDKKFYGINYLVGSIVATDHSNDEKGCGDNLPKCG